VSVDLRDDADEPAMLSGLIRDGDRRRDEAESLRIFYVALTRARDHLVLSGWLSKGKVPPRSWMGKLCDVYGLVDEAGEVADEIVFGEGRHAAPVRTDVPVVSESEAKATTHAAWKVVRRLGRLTDRMGELERLPPSDLSRRIDRIDVAVSAKRRFVPSEFTLYHYCPRRYRLEKIDGVLSSDAASVGRGRGNGALFGTLTHRVLAAWDFDAASLGAVTAQVLASAELPREVDPEALASEIEGLIAGVGGAGLLAEIAESPERLTEYPLAARVDDFIIDGIVDSVHRLADGTFEIVDWKTDRAGGRTVAEIAEHYEWQQAAYAVALSKTGMNVSRVSLVFLRAGARHSWTCDASQLAAWEASLRETVSCIRAGRFASMREGPCRCGLGWVCGRDAESTHDLDLS
jgi:ATP-dependent helicase/nuclease subunit A